MRFVRYATTATRAPPRRGGRRLPAPENQRIGSAEKPTFWTFPPAHDRPAPPRVHVPSEDRFNAPLYTLKAFTIATAIVVCTASASVVGVMAYLDVHNTTEFAARMRTWVSQSMPLLTSKIYRRATSSDALPDDPVLLAASTTRRPSSAQTAFDHDAAQQRLTDAFDEGGFDAWAEAAARELEAEIEVERAGKRTAI